MSILNNSLLLGADAGAGGYQISRSLRFNSADSAFLSRTPASAGNRKTWTWSGWVKLGLLGTVRQIFTARTSGTPYALFYIFSDDKISFADNTLNTHTTAAVYRDPSAWYHIQLAVDTTDATSANRVRLWVNGTLQTWASTTAPTQNADGQINTATAHSIGSPQPYASSEYFNGYLADIHFIDGQALTPSSFAETNATTGQWVPKAYAGSYGTNGFRLDFSDNSAATATTLGKDRAGSNNWTPNNLSVTAGAGNDSLVDTPTSYGTDTGAGGEVRGNYCTWNALAKGSDCTLSNGNLDVAWGSAGSTTQGSATIGMSSGKWYWETTITASSSSPTNAVLGITTKPFNDSEYPGYSATSWGYRGSDGQKWTNTSGSSYGASYANGDVVGVAFDADNGTLTFYKNGSSQGTAFTGLTSGPYFPAIGDQSSSQTFSAASNFGQRPFAYTAPSGFKALCDTNLPAPVVAKPNTAMDVATWSGDSASSRSITFSQSISPDLVWVKCRSNSAYHGIYDSVRGVNRVIFPNDTLAEINTPGNGYVSAFNSNGFTLTAGSLSSDDTNQSGRTYVGWAWDAGSSTVTNTQGSITSSVRANASAGFSIVTYTGNGTAGATVGHGLGAKPFLRIIKRRDAASTIGWMTFHESAPSSYFTLNSTNAATPASEAAPTSSVFSLPADANSNASGGTYVAYCFAPVAGYSSFGSYTGNGSSDGPFIFLGFRPKLLWVKRTNTSSDWWIYDTSRSPYNVLTKNLYTNSASAEDDVPAAHSYDFVSNGFKVRMGYNPTNNNGDTYIYCAWAESPFPYSRAR